MVPPKTITINNTLAVFNFFFPVFFIYSVFEKSINMVRKRQDNQLSTKTRLLESNLSGSYWITKSNRSTPSRIQNNDVHNDNSNNHSDVQLVKKDQELPGRRSQNDDVDNDGTNENYDVKPRAKKRKKKRSNAETIDASIVSVHNSKDNESVPNIEHPSIESSRSSVIPNMNVVGFRNEQNSCFLNTAL